MKLRLLFYTAFFILIANFSQGQGCSDAGFCTIGNLGNKKTEGFSKKNQSFKLALPVGVGDEEVFIFAPALEYNLQLSSRWAVQGKLTGNYASGNLGKATGLGDVFLSGTHFFNPSSRWQASATLGTKLPLNQGNLKENELSLPMQYQSSLGTIDLITGLAVSSAHWQFAGGWQQPLTGRNRNNFLPVYWDKAEALNYSPSNDFNRKGDVLLRSSYIFSLAKNLSFNTGLLGIYHLGKDTYIDANISNSPIPIEGSAGLTLNATGVANLQINSTISIGLTVGIPLVVREVRPDGLTRSYVISPDITINF